MSIAAKTGLSVQATNEIEGIYGRGEPPIFEMQSRTKSSSLRKPER